MDEKFIIKRIKENDEQAFQEMVKKYQSLVIKTCYGFVHNSEDAQDIAQEVFIEVYRSIHKFRMESKISTWLYRISVNKSINYIRDHKKNKWLLSLDLLFESEMNNKQSSPIDDSPYDIMEKDEKKQLLYRSIDNLPENQRIAFTLYKFEELSYKEISEIMNLSLSSVESLMFRAKKSLQQKLIGLYKKS
jgi:RNA polymerase sigma-70 factor, ECF subfamily